MAYNDDGTFTDEGGPQTPGGNWWEGPKPPGWPTAWPPPLPSGAHYGNTLGSIVYAEPTAGGLAPGAGAPLDLNDPTPDGDPYPMYHPPAPPPPGPPSPHGDPGTSGGSLGGLLSPFNYTGSQYQLPEVPVFTAPTYTPYEKFTDPTADEAKADPGYEFARAEGQRALEGSKAASGVYNTGGTLKDLIGYGNSFATQRYGDVRNRKMDTYLTNYKTQNIDPYEKLYRGAVDAFAPKMQAYGTESAWRQHANDLDWSHAYDVFRDQRDSTFNKTYQYLTA